MQGYSMVVIVILTEAVRRLQQAMEAAKNGNCSDAIAVHSVRRLSRRGEDENKNMRRR